MGFLERQQAPPVAVTVAGAVGLVLLLWALGTDLWHHMETREGAPLAKMFIMALSLGGVAALGIGGILYLVTTQPVAAQTTAEPPPRPTTQTAAPPPPLNSSHQSGGQAGGTINNYGPVYNAPTTQAPPAQPSAPPAAFLLGDHSDTTVIGGTFRIDGPLVQATGHAKSLFDDPNVVRPNDTKFPPPDGKFSNSSAGELKDLALKLSRELRAYAAETDARVQGILAEPLVLNEKRMATDESWKAQQAKLSRANQEMVTHYSTAFGPECLSLAEEIMSRASIERPAPKPDDGLLSVRVGWDAVLFNRLAGGNTSRVADFLDYVSAKLPDRAPKTP